MLLVDSLISPRSYDHHFSRTCTNYSIKLLQKRDSQLGTIVNHYANRLRPVKPEVYQINVFLFILLLGSSTRIRFSRISAILRAQRHIISYNISVDVENIEFLGAIFFLCTRRYHLLIYRYADVTY